MELKLPQHWSIFARFHVSDIKKYDSGYASAFTGRGIPPPPPALDADTDTWEVDTCPQKRHSRGQTVEVLVSWVGWARCENRWLRYEWLNEAAQAEADLLPFNAPSRAIRRTQQKALSRLTRPTEPPTVPAQPPSQPPAQQTTATRHSTRTRAPPKPRD